MTALHSVDRPAAIAALIEHYRDTPFAWGVHDCCLWPATGVKAQTGNDPAAALRGTYKTKREAVALIRREFGGRVENIPTKMGFQRVPLASCQRGWIVSKSFVHRISLGVCVGEKAAFTGPTGLVFVPMSECQKAWRVDLPGVPAQGDNGIQGETP